MSIVGNRTQSYSSFLMAGAAGDNNIPPREESETAFDISGVLAN